MDHSSGAVRTMGDIQVDRRHRPKVTWKKLTAVYHERNTCTSGMRSAMCAASQQPGGFSDLSFEKKTSVESMQTKIINSFMHMFNVSTLYRQSIKLLHQKLW